MFTSFIKMNDDGNLGWGLGFGTQVVGERSAFWQWGDYAIFRNYIIADPKLEALLRDHDVDCRDLSLFGQAPGQETRSAADLKNSSLCDVPE